MFKLVIVVEMEVDWYEIKIMVKCLECGFDEFDKEDFVIGFIVDSVMKVNIFF